MLSCNTSYQDSKIEKEPIHSFHTDCISFDREKSYVVISDSLFEQIEEEELLFKQRLDSLTTCIYVGVDRYDLFQGIDYYFLPKIHKIHYQNDSFKFSAYHVLQALDEEKWLLVEDTVEIKFGISSGKIQNQVNLFQIEKIIGTNNKYYFLHKTSISVLISEVVRDKSYKGLIAYIIPDIGHREQSDYRYKGFVFKPFDN